MFIYTRLASEVTHQKQLKKIAEAAMEQLMTLAHYTAVSISTFPLMVDCCQNGLSSFPLA